MIRLTRRQRMFIWVFGGMIGTVILVVPLIAYGFVANNSHFTYPKTTCRYTGYHIEHNLCAGPSKPFAGFLKFDYQIYNKSYVHRGTQIICDQSRAKIEKYFNDHYNNHTVWDCWYQRSGPATGWYGFYPPYNVNGTAMVTFGFIIFGVFVFTVGTYLILARKRYSGYHEIGGTYDDMDL